ncbi:MAG: ATPase, P-type (Transporting), HAD superfamily, subfamily IC [Candidatus Peregrinibacteria bacterium GW2011_GWA2_47_7]|nr:MAG: ATPase, P-type (Transporting), HAD superfamily, subfamily IC [Candidatus Peregrinibacteria bacterium GW2011_GWA2_47_7]
MAHETPEVGHVHVKGLSTAEAQERFARIGPNVIEGKRRTPLILQFLGQFKDIMVIILIVASLIAYLAGETVDAAIIIGIVFLNAAIGFAQEFKAEKAVEALRKLLAPKAHVVRNGEIIVIDAIALVPGDLLILNEGDKISADCEILSENELYVDEAILTGESVPVKKDPHEHKKVFMGTQVTHGNARALVTHTGMHTQFGKIARLTSETKKDRSPLQKELAHIGAWVGKVTVGISAMLFLIGIFLQQRGLIETLLFAVSVAVAAVPEGLPTTITVALALGVQRLARKNAIVKQLSSVETLGSTTVICSDKTGTLTKNEMTVQEVVFDDCEISVKGVGYEPIGELSVHSTSSKENAFFSFEKGGLADIAYKRPTFFNHLEMMAAGLTVCNNARLVEAEEWRIIGDPTEGALLNLVEKAGFSAAALNQEHPRIFEIPFDSSRKRMSVVTRDADSKKYMAFVKGAPDSLLTLCTHIFKDGKIVPLSAAEKTSLLERTDAMAKRALRIIAVAYKEVSQEVQRTYHKEEIESDLIFLGMVGMMDPPREEVKEAVKLTHKAGIRIFIITGDHGLTAHAIAKDLGIVKSYGVNIITGEMMEKMSNEKLRAAVAKGEETIFARVSPEHKLRVVEALKQLGEVVAVTGDGVNDAPALKRADIGVAMGITGTDVSKEAANMVLTDDSFGSIVSAVIEGRTIYENMKKFIFFIFSSNIGELIAIFSGILLGLPAPLTAVLILIVNTLTDVFPALALGVEPIEQAVLSKPPRKPGVKIMETPFIKRYLMSGIWIGLLTAGTFVMNLWLIGWRFGDALDPQSLLYRESATMAFVVLTLQQMVHAFSCRSEILSIFQMKFFENRALVAATLFSIIATVAVVQIPFISMYIKTVPLSLNGWLTIAAVSFSVLLVEEIRKIFVRSRMRAMVSKI